MSSCSARIGGHHEELDRHQRHAKEEPRSGYESQVRDPSEHRERALRELVRKSKRTVVLFIDEAHDLHHKTLVGLKRLREVVADGGGVLDANGFSTRTAFPAERQATAWFR